MFDRETEAQNVAVSPSEALRIVDIPAMRQLPSLGVILSTTADQEAHEWSRIQSGIFTHELLSGLYGPADVNGDGVIEYTEVQAFIVAANRDIRDPRAVPRLVAKAPARNQNAPLVDLSAMRDVVTLTGDPSSLGHFRIEIDNGQRLLDANLSEMRSARIVVPAHVALFVRTDRQEAEIAPRDSGAIPLSQLRFVDNATIARGSADAAYRTALFSSPYGVTYYKGFVDSIGVSGVRFSPPPPAQTTESLWRPALRATAITLWGVTALGAAAAVTTGLLAYSAYDEFSRTDLQWPAQLANQRYILFSNTSLITLGVAGVAAASGGAMWLLAPGEKPN
jgi:hypothetical protein